MTQSNEPATNKPPIGAVMVVGGGIAGMQSALDLADQGFKVYLVEAQSAIGGHMAQLDKTFPTNDCAMCTISPRLVETGRHPNITLMTDSEVIDVKGHAGDFNVRVRHNPRYIDVEKCVGCGDCSKVCPILIPDTFNEGLSKRRAAYKLYPQAVPNAYAIAKRGIAPCRDACPAGQRAQGYIALIREGRWNDALRVIKMDNPFPGICGRICNHRCETACNRGQVDEPINIRALKRFVTDKVYAEPRQPIEPTAPTVRSARRDHRRGAVRLDGGAGPRARGLWRHRLRSDAGRRRHAAPGRAGVSSADEHHRARSAGHRRSRRRSALESSHRQSRRHLQRRLRFGADRRRRARRHSPADPRCEPRRRDDQHAFLARCALGQYTDEGGGRRDETSIDGMHRFTRMQSPHRSSLGQRVVVLGGGNVAIDCARSAVRLGRHVEMACLESGDKVPAHPWEVQAAQEEGIILHEGRTFERILSDETATCAASSACAWRRSVSMRRDA